MQPRPSITRTGDPYLFAAQIALRDMRDPSLLVALDYLALLAELKPERFPGGGMSPSVSLSHPQPRGFAGMSEPDTA